VLPVLEHLFEEMAILLLLRSGKDEARIRRRILRLEVADRLEIPRVRDDFS
jgi:hypothetical protein